MKRTIEINDTLSEIIDRVWSEVKELVYRWLDDYYPSPLGEPFAPDLMNDLDYSGALHDIIDSSVPIYTGEITDLFYLHGTVLESAFDDAGFGSKKNDEDWPSGWRAAAIYCYIEQTIMEWYSEEADSIVEEWLDRRDAHGHSQDCPTIP